MGFMFCDIHVSLKYPFAGGYKFVEFVLFLLVDSHYHKFTQIPGGICGGTYLMVSKKF